MSAGDHDIEAMCELARRHGAAVEVDMKEHGAGRHPMLVVSFNGASSRKVERGRGSLEGFADPHDYFISGSNLTCCWHTM